MASSAALALERSAKMWLGGSIRKWLARARRVGCRLVSQFARFSSRVRR
jgi:hypothetical protein